MKHLPTKRKLLLPLSLVLGLLVLPSFAQAASISGVNVFVKETGTVSVTFSGSRESFRGTLYLEGHGKLFSSNIAAGTTINVGEYEAGQELNFYILVRLTGLRAGYGSRGYRTKSILGWYYTKSKFVVKNIDSGTYADLIGESNDVLFSFSNSNTETGIETATGIEGNKLVQNPEPSTIVLLGSGLLGLGAWRLRKKQP
jgi:hypothetical protein